jgi:hypothetical protein
LAGVCLLGEEGVEASVLLARQQRGDLADDLVIGGVHRRGRHALDDADTGDDDTLAPHPLDQAVEQRAPVGHADRLRLKPGRQLGT